jgi:CheY-like chemotaxis protein
MMSDFGTKRPIVLMVEDEALIRLNAVEMLTAAGYEVLEAANADEAIEILEARPDISILFTDIQMPGSIDGLKLAHAVRHRWPPIKIVTSSGHVNLTEDDLPDGARFVPKPYSDADIVSTFRELLAA